MASESDMAFTSGMDYSIDKEEFWLLSSDGPTAPSPPPASAPSGPFSDEFAHPRFSADSSFFDNYMSMDIEAPARTPVEDQNPHSPGDCFFMPPPTHSNYNVDEKPHGLELQVRGPSPPASASSAAELISMTGTASSHHSHVDDDHQSIDMVSTATSIPSMDGSTKSHTPRPSQGQQISLANGDPTNHVVLGHLNAETLEQRRRLLSGRRGLGQHQPVGGSISDSELLRLEGLSVNSPHGMLVAAGGARDVPPSSTQTQLRRSIASSTSTPPVRRGLPLGTSKSNINLSGRAPGGNPPTSADDIDLCNLNSRRQNLKTAGSRKFESIYASIRRAVGRPDTRGRPSQMNTTTNQHNYPRTVPMPQTVIPSHMESAKKATRRLASESQIMWDGLPISPPLTDMNNHQHGHFVAGLMDDPFFDSSMPFNNHPHPGLAPAAEINNKSATFNGNIPHTPLLTPNTKTEPLADDGTNYFPPTNDPWVLDTTSFINSSDLSRTATFLSGDSTMMNSWSFDPSSDTGSNMDFTNHNDNSLHTNRNHHNLTIQVPSYVTNQHDPHHTPDSSENLAGSGLMIHMPQPRTPNTAPLLSSQIHQTHTNIPLHDATTYPFPEGTPQHFLHQQQAAYSASRRPKPRAPSSGARFHTLGSGPNSISPRKNRQHSSSSESPSPTPGVGGARRSRSMARRQLSISGGPPQSALAHRKSTTDLLVMPSSDMQSHAVRKRRSTSSWRGSGAASRGRSTSGDAGAGGSSAGEISLDGGLGGIGFVNYTPSDHTTLMTGVAPSGSSKTKARREKEAEDKRRKLSEAMMKMASDAGVDVAMLKEEGIVI